MCLDFCKPSARPFTLRGACGGVSSDDYRDTFDEDCHGIARPPNGPSAQLRRTVLVGSEEAQAPAGGRLPRVDLRTRPWGRWGKAFPLHPQPFPCRGGSFAVRTTREVIESEFHMKNRRLAGGLHPLTDTVIWRESCCESHREGDAGAYQYRIAGVGLSGDRGLPLLPNRLSATCRCDGAGSQGCPPLGVLRRSTGSPTGSRRGGD